jgi:hypothetical protein
MRFIACSFVLYCSERNINVTLKTNGYRCPKIVISSKERKKSIKMWETEQKMRTTQYERTVHMDYALCNSYFHVHKINNFIKRKPAYEMEIF